MEEHLFTNGKNMTVEQLVTRINEIIGEKFSILDEQDDIEKWNSVPKLLMLNELDQNKLLEFASFIDSLFISIEEKIIYMVSLSGLIEFGGISLEKYDVGNLFTMADYYQNSSIAEIKNSIPIVGNPDLLTTIRNKTLDVDARKKILLNLVNQVFQGKMGTIEASALDKYLKETIQRIEVTDYYELIK